MRWNTAYSKGKREVNLVIVEWYAIITMMIPRRIQSLVLRSAGASSCRGAAGTASSGQDDNGACHRGRSKECVSRLESPLDREKLADATFYLSDHEDELVILDEVQRAPELFATLRGLIDQGRRRGKKSGRFLLLGSHRRIC